MRSIREIARKQISTSDGEFLALYSKLGLCGLRFPKSGTMARGGGEKMSEPVETWHAITVQALKAALQGRQPDKLPELDLSSGTDFQKQVWRALCGIRAGQTLSYGGVAEKIGNPRAMRAVGGACGSNPIPVLIPCHRVIAANQSLGGFSADMKWKRILLSREGVRLSGL